MIVEEISLEHWRGFGQRHSFSFSSGINLLAGENEAGKSTIFEALWRVMFDRHNSTAAEIRDIQPEGTSLAPTASVVFTQSGRRYRITKRFINHPVSELSLEDKDGFRLIHDGDMADRKVIEIVGGVESAKGASRDYHRGISHALWYLQREEALPEESWSAAIREGLGSVIQKVASTPREEKVLKLIEEDYQSVFTPTGKLKESSELRTAEKRAADIKNELTLLGEKKRSLGVYRESVDTLLSGIAELVQRKEMKEENIRKLREDVKAGSEIESKLQKIRAELDKKEVELLTAEKLLGDVRKRSVEMDRLESELESLREALIKNEIDLRATSRTKISAHERWHDDVEPRLKQIELSLTRMQAVERLRKLEKDRLRLKGLVERKRILSEKLTQGKEELGALKAPGEKEWSDYRQMENELRIAEAEVRASAIRVSFRLEKSTLSIRPTPPASKEGNEYSVDRPTTFNIEGVGDVEVRGGGKSLEESRDGVEKARQLVEAVLLRFSSGSTQDLGILVEKRRRAEASISEIERELKLIEGEEPEAEKELPRIDEGIELEMARAGEAAAEFSGTGGQKIREITESMEKTKAELIVSIESLQKEEREASERESKLLMTKGELEGDTAEIKARASILAEENARTISQFGSLQLLQRRVDELQDSVTEHRSAAAEISRVYTEKVEGPGKRLSESESELSAILKRKEELDHRLIEARTRIEAAAGENINSRITDLEAESSQVSERAGTLRRRANGLRLLRETMLTCRQAVSNEFAKPVAVLVSRWFETVTDGRYEGVEMNGKLLPTGARKSGGESTSLQRLSHGTREQVVVLVRLALGVLSSETERNLVVLDDRLVNADPVRLKRLSSVLEEAAGKCQIVLATCNELSYMSDSAKIVRVPVDGMVGF